MERTEKIDNETIITLCARCYQDYSAVPGNRLLLHQRHTVDTCMHCQMKNGWDYLLVESQPKRRKSAKSGGGKHNK